MEIDDCCHQTKFEGFFQLKYSNNYDALNFKALYRILISKLYLEEAFTFECDGLIQSFNQTCSVLSLFTKGRFHQHFRRATFM